MQAETTWQKSASSQIVLDSIFAGLAAVWITIAINDSEMSNAWKCLDGACSLLSFFVFAISAEGTTNAYEERDVLKFVYYMLWYNVGVILIATAIEILTLSHFGSHILSRVGSSLSCVPPNILQILIWMGYGVFWFVLLWRWLYDSYFLLCASPQKFKNLLNELDDKSPPEFDRHWLMRQVFRRRLRDEKTST